MYSVFYKDQYKKRQKERELKKNGGKTITLFYSPFVNSIGLENSVNESYVNKKIHRNSLCHCNSGKKYKKCCLNTGRSEHILKYKEKG